MDSKARECLFLRCGEIDVNCRNIESVHSRPITPVLQSCTKIGGHKGHWIWSVDQKSKHRICKMDVQEEIKEAHEAVSEILALPGTLRINKPPVFATMIISISCLFILGRKSRFLRVL